MSTGVGPPLTFLLILAAKEGRGRQGAAPLAGLKGMNIPLLSDLSRAAELSRFSSRTGPRTGRAETSQMQRQRSWESHPAGCNGLGVKPGCF